MSDREALSDQGGRRVGPIEYTESERIVADILDRHRYPLIGADSGEGKYAVYFYSASNGGGVELRHVGGFATTRDAARAVHIIVAQTIVEDLAVWEHDSTLDPEGDDA